MGNLGCGAAISRCWVNVERNGPPGLGCAPWHSWTKRDERSQAFVFASSKLSWVFLLFADDILSIAHLTSTPCHPGRFKQMMKTDDVMVCKSAKHDHLNSALAHYIIRTIDLLSDHVSNILIKINDLREREMLWYLNVKKHSPFWA